jgi:hypothetical protein
VNRCLALVFALFLTFVTVSTTCIAAPTEWVRFTLEPAYGGAGIHASFRKEDGAHSENNWSTSFMPSQLSGLDLAGFHAGGTRPLRFAIVREAGRLDCAGNGGNSYAAGNCGFTADPAFTQLLVSRGIGRPTGDQAFGLMAVNARRELIDAMAAARYPTPTIDDLTAMTALGVSGQYVGDLSRAGYRPQSVHSLIEFKALNVTPEWIGGLTRIGYANVPAEQLVQLKALNVTPEFITGFDRIGYRHLPVQTLVQLKALDITPEFVRSAVGRRSTMPPVSELVQIKLFGKQR